MTESNQDARKPYWERKIYWPFKVLPPEKLTEQHQREIRFLEAAFSTGYKPYQDAHGNLGACSHDREAWIIVRGRRRWQIFLWISEETLHEVLRAHLDDFECAAEAVLHWLRGDDPAAILARLRGHLIATPATGSGFTLQVRLREISDL
jgi:hypothetical protein